MKAKLFTIIVAVILFTVSGLYAVPDKIFTSDGIIREGDDYANVYIYDTPPDRTTVSMFGGSASNMLAYDSSILNMTGGTTEVYARNQSTINLSGGRVPTLVAYDSSNVNVFGGSAYGLYSYDTGTVNVFDNADLDILRARGYSIANVTGGILDLVSASQFGTVNLLGGLVTDNLAAGDSGIINVYGYNLGKSDTGGKFGNGFVWGDWEGGVLFNFDFYGSETYSHVMLYEIPEPCTVLLIAIGSVALRRRRTV